MPKVMEKLEITLNETLVDLRNSSDKKDTGIIYSGLRLIENGAYQSGTSIKYWM